VTFSVHDVIAVEGERDPPAAAGPITVDVAVVVLGTGDWPFDLASCQAVSDAVPARIADFATASGGHVLLNNLVTGGAACTAFTSAAPGAAGPPAGGGCAVAPPRAPPLVLVLLAAVALRFRLRRRR
jgi:MYXO-CTERM domain-containing protein